MIDYYNVIPNKTRLMQKHFTPGRGGRKIRYITRHHTAGILNTDQVWQVWQTRQASAHYIVETNGQTGQLVWDRDTAWANGNQQSNQESITIEHSNNGGAPDWPISDATIIGGARLAAALCRFYKLGRPEFGKNIRDHREFYGTSCPHHLAKGGKYHQRWMSEAQRFYDLLDKRLVTPLGEPIMPHDKNTGETDMAADLDTVITAMDGTKHKARDLIAYTDGRVYELHGEVIPRLEKKLDAILEKLDGGEK